MKVFLLMFHMYMQAVSVYLKVYQYTVTYVHPSSVAIHSDGVSERELSFILYFKQSHLSTQGRLILLNVPHKAEIRWRHQCVY